ncbi:unnamed protein product, partial [Leptidea sinapis]
NLVECDRISNVVSKVHSDTGLPFKTKVSGSQCRSESG